MRFLVQWYVSPKATDPKDCSADKGWSQTQDGDTCITDNEAKAKKATAKEASRSTSHSTRGSHWASNPETTAAASPTGQHFLALNLLLL